MIKTLLAIVGAIALIAGVIIYNKNPEIFSGITNSLSGSGNAQSQKAPDSEELLENPSVYLKKARTHAEKSLKRICILEVELRAQQKEFATKARQKEQLLASSELTLEKIKSAVKSADAKFGAENPNWSCDWPYPGSTLSRSAIAERAVQLKEERDHSEKMLKRYRELDFAFSKKIIIINDKRSELNRAVKKIANNQEYIDAGNRLREADRLAEEMDVSLDMSDVFAEMESLDSLILDTTRADGIEARKQAVFAKLLNED